MEPTQSAIARARWLRFVLLWGAALAAALGLGSWIRQELAVRSQRDGTSAVSRAVRLANAAREADAAGDLDNAVEGSWEALELLRGTQGARSGAPYATALVELASRIVRQDAVEGRDSAVTLLEEAWELPGLAPALRGRIARDRGALELLRGESEAAHRWYELAEQEEGSPSPRLDALRESARLAGPDGQ